MIDNQQFKTNLTQQQKSSMKQQKKLIKNRYLYNPQSPLRNTQAFTQYKAYDTVSQKSLILHIHNKYDSHLQKIKQTSHIFLQQIIDIVQIKQIQQFVQQQPINKQALSLSNNNKKVSQSNNNMNINNNNMNTNRTKNSNSNNNKNNNSKYAVLLQNDIHTNLQQILHNNNFITQNDCIVLFKFMLLGLTGLHDKLIIHGNICLQNIFFCQNSLIKLGWNLYGNENYNQINIHSKSPQKLKQQKCSYASDIYCLGVILYQMLYGCYPFEGNNEQQLLQNIKNKKYIQQKTISPLKIIVTKQLKQLLYKMLQFNQQNRPKLKQILASPLFSFPLQTNLHYYKQKQKQYIISQQLSKKYKLIRQSKIVYRYNDYYQQNCYLALNLQQNTFVNIFIPDINAKQAQRRKLQIYYQKLQTLKQLYHQYQLQHNNTTQNNNNNNSNININNSITNICKLLQYENYKQQPILILQYCNQGDLQHYLQKIKQQKIQQDKKQQQFGIFHQNQINMIMSVILQALKQMQNMGLLPLHTLHIQKIMIKDNNIKIRQPGLLTPFIQKKLLQQQKQGQRAQTNLQIDYFAPQLKQTSDFVDLGSTDLWAFGLIYYFLANQGQLPKQMINNQISCQNLNIMNKNKKLIKKCLSKNINKRPKLQDMKIQGFNQSILNNLLQKYVKKQQLLQQNGDLQNRQTTQMKYRQKQNKRKKTKNKQVQNNTNKSIFYNYNKILTQPTSNTIRISIRIILGLTILWVIFFGKFIINGGMGVLKTNYYRPTTFQVTKYYQTMLYNISILTKNGTYFSQLYKDYSYEQITIDLNCTQNNHTSTSLSQGFVDDYINNSHSTHCFFGFIYLLVFTVCYCVIQSKLDLPTILQSRKQNVMSVNSNNNTNANKNSKYIYFAYILMFFIKSSLLFCFFTIFTFQYVIQISPCLGIQNQTYPKFTSVQTLLNYNISNFFKYIFCTVILWAILMYLFVFIGLFVQKIKQQIYNNYIIIAVIGFIIFVQTLICRIGFGKNIPLQPTWTYKINKDLTQQYWGLFGLFPQILLICVVVMDRITDFIFWFFLRLKMNKNKIKLSQMDRQISNRNNIRQKNLNIDLVNLQSQANESFNKFNQKLEILQ